MHTLTIYQRQRLLAKVLQLHTSAAFCWEEEDRFDVLRHQKVVAKRTERAHGAMHASSNASATRHMSRFGRGGGCDTWMMQLPAREIEIVSKLTIRPLMIASTTRRRSSQKVRKCLSMKIFVIAAITLVMTVSGALAHGGGCRKSSPPGQCCHMDNSTGTFHCH